MGPGLVDNTPDGILFNKRLLHLLIDVHAQSGVDERHGILVGIEDEGVAVLNGNLGECRVEQFLQGIEQLSLGNGELLSDEQEQQLAVRIEAGDDEAAGQLASANLRYVVSVAKGYAGRGLALDDLVSEGNMGLLRAAAKYKGTQKKRFVVFAAPFVRESIERAISEQAGLSSMPTEKADAEKSRNKVRSVDEPIPAGSKLEQLGAGD